MVSESLRSAQVIIVDIQDPAQRFQIVERLLHLYGDGEISTRRCITLLERLYVTGTVEQQWNWPDVYVTSNFKEGDK
jgi:hypothetical protein